jgi:hypothetical protein
MDFIMNSKELDAMGGLPHAQQLAYLRGIRPYMDVKTGLVGIKRGISLQSIAEELYIEPHQGIKSQKYSRAQIRRALMALERVGLISLQSENLQLILKCNLATLGYFNQNKMSTNPSQKTGSFCLEQTQDNSGLYTNCSDKPVTQEPLKAVTPLIKEDHYIYLLKQFEHFWRMYPEKKSRERAFEIFQQINPDEYLLKTILKALAQQIKDRKTREAHGEWVPAWKFPTNWLSQRCWEDEVTINFKQEKRNEKCRSNTRDNHDPFWSPEAGESVLRTEDECHQANIINLQYYR